MHWPRFSTLIVRAGSHTRVPMRTTAVTSQPGGRSRARTRTTHVTVVMSQASGGHVTVPIGPRASPCGTRGRSRPRWSAAAAARPPAKRTLV
eukprot:291250-Rhodomonas_salina.2